MDSNSIPRSFRNEFEVLKIEFVTRERMFGNGANSKRFEESLDVILQLQPSAAKRSIAAR